MAKTTDLRKQFTDRFDTKAEKQQFYKAFTGDYNNVVNVPGRPGFIYVRDWGGLIHIVKNTVVPTDQANYMVYIGPDPFNPRVQIVLGLVNAFDTNVVPGIPIHHETHEWPASDTVWVQSMQIVPALVMTKAGMVVTIYPFWAQVADGTFKYVPMQDLDMTSYRPSKGACWGLLSIDTSGNIVVTTTEPVANLTLLLSAPIPVPQNVRSFAAIALHVGQGTIIQNAGQNQIADLRWGSGAAGDMLVTSYDTDGDGKVDLAAQADMALYAVLAGRARSADAIAGTTVDPTLNVNDGYVLTWNGAASQWESLAPGAATVPASLKVYMNQNFV